MTRKRILFIVRTVFVITAMVAATSVLACEQTANTPLEKLYCQVQAKGEGAGLPSFDDFRRNSPQTQRLLLKRPAKKAGLPLPKASVLTTSSAKPSLSPTKSSPLKPASSMASAAQHTKTLQSHALASLKHCSIKGAAIHCGNTRYRLLDNLPNKKLSPNALTRTNILTLPAVPNGLSNNGLSNNGLSNPATNSSSNIALHDYLQKAYGEYLRKMHTIGLAGATLTYSKFYYIFEEGRKQKQDFVKRFGDMYTYLKKDKSTIAVGRAHKNKPQPALANCEPIRSYKAEFIVCDEKGVNWVYQSGL